MRVTETSITYRWKPGKVEAPAGVEFLGDDDVGVADEADEGDEGDHDEEGQSRRVAPEEVLDAGAFGHRLLRVPTNRAAATFR